MGIMWQDYDMQEMLTCGVSHKAMAVGLSLMARAVILQEQKFGANDQATIDIVEYYDGVLACAQELLSAATDQAVQHMNAEFISIRPQIAHSLLHYRTSLLVNRRYKTSKDRFEAELESLIGSSAGQND